MVELNFNANEHEPQSFDVLPPGEYEVCITGSQMKPTKTGGEMLELTLQILSGEYQNRKLWDRLNLVNSNPEAVKIANGTLSSICRAVGVLTPKDSSELHNKPLIAKIAIQKATEKYDESNKVKAYKPREPVNERTQPDAMQPAGDSEPDWG